MDNQMDNQMVTIRISLMYYQTDNCMDNWKINQMENLTDDWMDNGMNNLMDNWINNWTDNRTRWKRKMVWMTKSYVFLKKKKKDANKKVASF